ncbi:MAG: HD domain-containing protein [archaeon]
MQIKSRRAKFSSWTQREKVAGRYMRAAFRKMGQKGELTSAHNLGHVQRVSLYAAEYVKAMGGGRKKRAQARIAGMTHDRFRDAVQSLGQKKEESHETRSAKYMQPLFESRYKKSASKAIVEAMAKHGSFPALNEIGKNVVRDGVVFADKFFEANGAYIGFRRAMFMGERADIKERIAKEKIDITKKDQLQKLAVDVTLGESSKRLAAFSDLSKIPSHLHPFVRYQVEWQHKLVSGLQSGEPGIVNLVTTLFAEGLKSKPRDLAETIRAYSPLNKTDREFQREALDYLDGKLAVKFRQLVKKTA